MLQRGALKPVSLKIYEASCVSDHSATGSQVYLLMLASLLKH